MVEKSQAQTVGENPVGEKVSVGENLPQNEALVKTQKPLKSKEIEFSPTQFSLTPSKGFSPARKPRLKLVGPVKNGLPGRPRNPELPPSPGKYFYWGKARNGLKLERRKPSYEYIGFIMPNEWQYLRGHFNEEYILRAIIAAIRVKRARAAQGWRTGTSDN